MKREQAVVMFSTLVLMIAILGGGVIALSAKYNELKAEHLKVYSAYETCNSERSEGGTP